MRLRKLNGGHINAVVHQKEIARIQPHTPRARGNSKLPITPEPKQFVTQAQSPLELDNTPSLNKKGIKRVQQIAGSILYYA